ncbi:phosphoenolpyruvate synthase [Pedobacter gandavensis]|uniref:phosphoenolpyruvate synthase n=1 Tax=Pedobacter gandavensis TaxID=2679963 RepID=UPI002478371D|nr:phosphoenolpyruvate synthase [Pedobacter gandavensis]WGQ09844.1 phosphoenolpyruvate synthase [Pedobacter gandavensis]
MEYVKKFSEIGMKDIAKVGGKNASLGEMFTNLTPKGILIPKGFAVTVEAYQYFIRCNQLEEALAQLMKSLDKSEFKNLEEVGAKARALMMSGRMTNELGMAILGAYDAMFDEGSQEVAVRSSATAEDLPESSFAGLHESYLNIRGNYALLHAVKQCFASLYTDRAIKYREDKGFEHSKVFLSVGIQEMIRSDIGCSGIGFTLEPESGFRNIVHIAGVWGLGENIVQGTVTPDEFLVFKPSLEKGFRAVIQKNLGSKHKTMAYAKLDDDVNSTVNNDTPADLQDKFVLEDIEIEKLAKWALIIEEHYQVPMDFEWAKDGIGHQLYIIQARPETVHSQRKILQLKSYHLEQKGIELTRGEAIGSRIVSGPARILTSPKEAGKLNQGDILITDTTSPDWDPILKKVAGIVTNRGGRTSHAAIIARELGAAAIVGTTNATTQILDGDLITLDCSAGKTGFAYQGQLSWKETIVNIEDVDLPASPKAQLIIADPEKAFELSFYPNHGVGLLRLEFLISNCVKIHPMALIKPDQVSDEKERLEIEELTRLYADKESYFIDQLSKGVATIAAAFYPKEVIVRMSDFKSNEYAGLIGGQSFEPKEENPMLGFRGASRYHHERYREGFRLECEAMKLVRNEIGLTNVKLMIPFCRTVQEGKKVIELMKEFGLKQGDNGLEIFVMAEIPSNIILAEEFAEVFDGFSIGSNDLTQLTLGIDRDSALVADLFDEENAASKFLIVQMIRKAKLLNKKVGLCGQAPSDSESFTHLLVENGISSIAFNADALIKGIATINKALKQEVSSSF